MAAVIGSRIYVAGGSPAGRTLEAYDPRSNTWESLTPMATPRHGIGAAVLGGLVYVPGGATVQGFGATGVHEVFTAPTAKSCQ